MARPPIVQKLRHDRLLCGSVFRFFVETWNWLTSWVDNAKGDAEVDPQKGYITIDRTDPDSPIIRFRADRLPTSGGGSTVVPDDVSTEFITTPSGQTPGADEGKLQVKGWKTGTPEDPNNIADYLMGAANVPANGLNLVARWTDSDGAHLVYLPISKLYQNQGGDLTVEFVGKNDWYVNGSTHQLRQRLKILNLRTGVVTDKANTTYANGWEVTANAVGISTVIGS